MDSALLLPLLPALLQMAMFRLDFVSIYLGTGVFVVGI